MDKRIGAKDLSAAMRAAHRLGDDAVSIVKACSAVKGSDDKASDRLDSVAADARQDLGYVLCRVQWLKSKEKIVEAARLILAAPKETVAPAPESRAKAARPGRLPERLRGRARRSRAGKRQLSFRLTIHAGLDRAALSQ
jgi:hypothetical protein